MVRGELLADEPYADWAIPLRDLYAERVVTLRLDLAEDALAEGDSAPASALAAQVLGAQPTSERTGCRWPLPTSRVTRTGPWRPTSGAGRCSGRNSG